MLFGYISQITSVSALDASPIRTGSAKSDSAREELRTALNNTFPADQCSQVFHLRPKYRSVLSLSPQALDRCTIAEEGYPHIQEHILLID